MIEIFFGVALALIAVFILLPMLMIHGGSILAGLGRFLAIVFVVGLVVYAGGGG